VAAATALAASLEQQGYHEAAAALRKYAEQAGKTVVAPKSVPVPGIPPAMQRMIDKVLAMERNPRKLRAIAKALRSLPNAAANPQIKIQADMLDAMAAQLEAQQKQAQVLTEIDTTLKSDDISITTPGFVPPPLGTLPVKPIIPQTPPKTPVEKAADAAGLHLRKVQSRSGGVKAAKGREDQALVKRFQALAGTSADGKAGPGTLGLMAKHGVCDLPLVMYWPRGSTKSKVLTYREALYSVADRKSEPCASKIRTSAARERGQAGIVGSMPA